MGRRRRYGTGCTGGATLLAAVCLVMLLSAPGHARSLTATWVGGTVETGPGPAGPWAPVREGAALEEGVFVRTGEDGRIEISLADGSVIRLGRDTRLQIRRTVSERHPEPAFVSELQKGRFWARVGKVFTGKKARFFSNLSTAVIGVRGTVYRIDAAEDSSADIYVYDGVVGVGPPLIAEGAAREEMAWPAEVSETQWEEIILRQLQRLRIDADGRPGKTQAFDPTREVDEWVVWNRERDAMLP